MKQEISARWRIQAGLDNPAGPLFTGGKNAEADIVCETGTLSGKCGTACTGSGNYQCC
jgi:hypothetical protein